MVLTNEKLTMIFAAVMIASIVCFVIDLIIRKVKGPGKRSYDLLSPVPVLLNAPPALAYMIADLIGRPVPLMPVWRVLILLLPVCTIIWSLAECGPAGLWIGPIRSFAGLASGVLVIPMIVLVFCIGSCISPPAPSYRRIYILIGESRQYLEEIGDGQYKDPYGTRYEFCSRSEVVDEWGRTYRIFYD